MPSTPLWSGAGLTDLASRSTATQNFLSPLFQAPTSKDPYGYRGLHRSTHKGSQKTWLPKYTVLLITTQRPNHSPRRTFCIHFAYEFPVPPYGVVGFLFTVKKKKQNKRIYPLPPTRQGRNVFREWPAWSSTSPPCLGLRMLQRTTPLHHFPSRPSSPFVRYISSMPGASLSLFFPPSCRPPRASSVPLPTLLPTDVNCPSVLYLVYHPMSCVMWWAYKITARTTVDREIFMLNVSSFTDQQTPHPLEPLLPIIPSPSGRHTIGNQVHMFWTYLTLRRLGIPPRVQHQCDC